MSWPSAQARGAGRAEAIAEASTHALELTAKARAACHAAAAFRSRSLTESLVKFGPEAAKFVACKTIAKLPRRDAEMFLESPREDFR